jgi:hypothetical protein
MRILPLALAAATSLAAATPMLAQNVGLRAFPELNLTGFSGEPTALPKAVSNIETLSGGRVVEIRYNNVAGVPSYDVVVAQGDQVRFLRFSRAGSAPLELTETATPAWMLDWRAEKNVNLGQVAKVRLADAIRTAEANKGGSPAVAAGIARGAADPNNAVKAYNVSILNNGVQQRVAVDSETGSVIANPEALAAW